MYQCTAAAVYHNLYRTAVFVDIPYVRMIYLRSIVYTTLLYSGVLQQYTFNNLYKQYHTHFFPFSILVCFVMKRGLYTSNQYDSTAVYIHTCTIIRCEVYVVDIYLGLYPLGSLAPCLTIGFCLLCCLHAVGVKQYHEHVGCCSHE